MELNMRLYKKTFIKYNGPVYDLCVNTTDHSYNINGIVVHNSVSGSLIAYVIGLTEVDPIKHKLMFSRFLDLGRDKVYFAKLI